MRRKANVVLAVLMKNRYLVAGAVVLVFALLLSTEARAQVRTGQYNGNGTYTEVFVPCFWAIKSLTIVHVALRGPSEVAYTTNVIQEAAGGTFLNGNKRDSGVTIEGAAFTVTNPDFNVDGVLYKWEARGDPAPCP